MQEQQTPPNPTKIKFHKKTTEKKRSRSGERVRVSPMKETPLKSQLKPARQQSVTYESNLKIYNEEHINILLTIIDLKSFHLKVNQYHFYYLLLNINFKLPF